MRDVIRVEVQELSGNDMRNVDSPAICTGGILRKIFTSGRHNTRKRMFRGHSGYKEMEPYVEECCPYREDSLDFLVAFPPRYE